MNKSPLKIGVIGGGIGRIHIDGYQLLKPAVEVVALCDVDEARLQEIGESYAIPWRYTDAYELLASDKVEAVSICVPNNLHAPFSIAALEAGLHVLCEKPLAHTVADSQKVVEAAGKAPGKFMICYNRRYRPDILWMKKLIEEAALGRIYQVKAGWTREEGIPAGWFVRKALSGGGPLVDLGVHILDAVMWLLGYPRPLTVSGDVQANFGPHRLKIHKSRRRQGSASQFTVEDSATAFIRLAGGVSFMFETSWASHARPRQDDIFITLQGTKGTIELSIANYANVDTLTLYTEVGGQSVTIRPDIRGRGHDHNYAIAEFVRCVTEDRPPAASAENGLVVMQMMEAIYRSSELGREVTLNA